MIVTIKPPGREEYALDLSGTPTFSASLDALGYESATIPCQLDDDQRTYALGATVRIHGAGWQGIVVRRPGPVEPLVAQGWGWCGSLDRRAVAYCRTDISAFKERTDGNGNAWELSNIGGVLKIGQSAGSTLTTGPMGAYYFWDPDITVQSIAFSANVNHADVSLAIHASDTESARSTNVYTKTATGAQTEQTATIGGKHGFVISCLMDAGPSTPTAFDKWVSVYDLKMYGTTVTNPTTHNLIDDILGNEIQATYLPSGEQYLAWIAAESTVIEPLVFPSCDANTKLREVSKYAAYDFGWYTEMVAGRPCCVPHWTPRSTVPDYVLRLDECESYDLDEAALDELASKVRVSYTDSNGRTVTRDVTDTDPTHPLVAAGITRCVDVSAQTSSGSTADAIGAVALSEQGRRRSKGSVTTRVLRTATGTEAYLPHVRPGSMIRVFGLPDGKLDATLRRITCVGDAVATLELDQEGYRLDIALANLAKRQ